MFYVFRNWLKSWYATLRYGRAVKKIKHIDPANFVEVKRPDHLDMHPDTWRSLR